MLTIPPPKSTNERQRLFQLRHPGYDRRRKARQRASSNRAAKQLIAKLKAAALRRQLQSTPVTIPLVATPVPLMLPAPVQDPLIAELNALAASMRQRELVPAVSATRPAPIARAYPPVAPTPTTP